MRFSSSETEKIIEMIDKGKSISKIKEELGIEDADWLYEVTYRFSDRIRRIDDDYSVARKFIDPTFYYYGRIVESIKQLSSGSSSKLYKVLEHGCGAGSFAKQVVDNLPNVNVLGVELTAAGVEKAKGFENDRLHFLCVDGYEIEGKGEYDCVYHVNVLEHVPDGVRYLEKGLELLREDGHLIFCCPTKGSWIIWGLPKWIVCKITGREFKTHSFDENEVMSFVKNKGLIFLNDYSEFTMPRRIYRYFPLPTYRFLGLFSSKAERICKLLGVGRFCNFQYWHIGKPKASIRDTVTYDLQKKDLIHILWVLPAFSIVYIFYTIFMAFEVIIGRKGFFQQD